MLTLWQECRFAARGLAKTPMFSIVALVSLAIGIGANSTMFSLINALLLRPLPVREPGKLVELSVLDTSGQRRSLSLATYQGIKGRRPEFSSMFAWAGGALTNFEINGNAFAGSINKVTEGCFSTLGVQPFLGRLIGPEDLDENQAVVASVAVIDFRCWQQRFNSDPQVIGKSIRIEGAPFTVIGVTPESFAGLSLETAAEVTVPLSRLVKGRLVDSILLSINVAGRLNDGVSLNQARTHLQAIWPGVLQEAVPGSWQGEQRTQFLKYKLQVESAATGNSSLRRRFANSLVVLMGAVGLILFLACLNVANLMLTRMVAQQGQLGIRIALGASRWRVASGQLAESLLLAFAGAVLGLAASWWSTRFLVRLLWTGYVPLLLDPTPDGTVMAFTTIVLILTAVVVSLLPAWRATNTAPAGLMRSVTRTQTSARFAGHFLIGSQVALSLILLVGAALFARTLRNLQVVDAGYERRHLLAVQLFPRTGGYKDLDQAAYYHALAEKLGQLPGVQEVSFSKLAPLSSSSWKELVAATPTSPSLSMRTSTLWVHGSSRPWAFPSCSAAALIGVTMQQGPELPLSANRWRAAFSAHRIRSDGPSMSLRRPRTCRISKLSVLPATPFSGSCAIRSRRPSILHLHK